jgi:tRNA (guanine37-N1)-methyltransferase
VIFYVITLFPELFTSFLGNGVIGRAITKEIIDVRLSNLRDFAVDKHGTVDDYQYGGGPGMLLRPEPVFMSYDSIIESSEVSTDDPVVLLTPQGSTLNQPVLESFSSYKNIVLICGRYEGIDERVTQDLVSHEISIGDYIITGGELGAMLFIESLSRLVPGVLGSSDSNKSESFSSGILDYPQYTRPAVYRDLKVPDVLLSGDHKKIELWRRKMALKRTLERRPDLLENVELTFQDKELLGDEE